jgi:prepilin-type N-terminal cleavage/methylation domain-containing protein
VSRISEPNRPSAGGRCPAARGRSRERGFTLLELVIAMVVFSFVTLGLYGVIVLGARSAGSGERITEQARRYRVANEVISRQIASAAPICLPEQDEEDELGFKNPTSANQVTDDTDEEDEDDDDDGDDEEDDADDDGGNTVPFFVGLPDSVEFVTSAPQRPDASGLAIVSYWLEDGTLKMSERPVISAWSHSSDDLGERDREEAVSTILLYDVESVEFAYLRESDDEDWLDEWDAVDEDALPAVVRIDVRPSAVGGPDFYHEVAVLVGAMNQVSEADEDFSCSGG